MKLPGINYSQGVKPLATPPSGAEATLAKGRAQASMLNDFAKVAKNVAKGIAQDKGNAAYADASLLAQQAYADAMKSPDALGSPDLFQKASDEIKSQAQANMSGMAFSVFESKFNVKVQGMNERLIVDSTFRANKEQKISTTTKLMKLARVGEVSTAVELANESVLFTDAEKEQLYSEMNNEFAAGNVESAIYSNDPDVIASEINNLTSSDYSGPLEGRARSSAISSLEIAYKDSTAAMQEAVAHQRGKILGDIRISIMRGESGPLQIEEAYNSFPEFITPQKRAELLSLAERTAEERQNKMGRKVDVRQALALGEPLDPKNKDHIKGLDEVFEEDPTIQNGTDLTIKTNIMPSVMEAEFRRQAIAGKPQRVLELSNAFEVLQREAPQALGDLGSKQIAVYSTVASLNRGGVPLAEAVDIARTNAAKSPEERQQYRINLKTESKTSTERLQNLMDSSDLDVSYWPTGAPKPSPAMQAAYASMEVEYYTLMGGDVDLAKEAAFNNLLRIYSTTDINGDNQVMAYAPDRVTGLPTEYLRRDLNRTVKKNDPKLIMKDVFVTSDAQTARERGVKSYPMYKLNKFQLPEPVLDADGKQLRWTPKVGKYKEDLKIQRGKALERERLGGLNVPGKEQQFLFGGG